MDGVNTTQAGNGKITRQDLADAVRASAMLVEMSISMWSGELTDKSITGKIKTDANARGDVGYFRKKLLAGCEGPLKTCKSAHNAVRTRHYQLCPPWISDPKAATDRGPRLLSSALSMTYMTEIGQLRRIAKEQLDVFCDRYQELVEEAKANLGDLAKDSDYPSVEHIRESFKITTHFEPIPDKASFPNLPDQMFDRLSKTYASRQRKSAELALAHVWAQTRQHVGHMGKILSDPEAKFRSATLEHVKALVWMLPGLDMFGDSRLAEIASDIARMTDGLEVGELRDNIATRQDVANQCKNIIEKLDQFGV